MSLDLHPEELLYQQTLRPLGDDERADLDAHLARCAVCRMHVRLRPALAAVATPVEADYALAARVVERVLALDAGALARAVAPRPLVTTPRVARVAVAAVILLGTGVATSAIVGRLGRLRAPAGVVEDAGGADKARARRGGSAPRVALVAPAPTEPPVAAQPAPPPVAPVPSLPPLEAPRRARAAPPTAPPTLEEAPSVPAPPPVVAPSESPPLPALSEAAVLFARAESAQRHHAVAEAADLFRELAAKYPGVREEVAARPLFGHLLLEDLKRPRQALELFERYLRDAPEGALAEEAGVGRAQALEHLGRTDEARAAWQDFLRHFPDSVHGPLARQRLAAIGAKAP